MLADVGGMHGAGDDEMLPECEAAVAVLEAEDDLEGLAEALTMVGKLRFWLGSATAGGAILERAIVCARHSGNHRAQMRASHWLAVTFHVLPIPVDAGITRTEELLREASGDRWAEADVLKPLSVLYAFAGRSGDAHAALARSQSIFAGLGAEFALAESAIPAGMVGLAVGDPAAAERYLRRGYDAFLAMGERGYAMGIAHRLAEALYAQRRFDEAQQVITEARALTSRDFAAEIGRLTEARLLARRGQFAAAHQLVDAEQGLVTPDEQLLHAEVLETRAEVERLAGAPGQAEISLRAALRIYEDRRATALAYRVRAALSSVHAGTQPGGEPA
jgi:tetratricopeptide (TPR) repeat protein